MSSLVLTTQRLRLTPLSSEHFEDFYRLDRDPEVMKYLRPPSRHDSEARERFERLLNYNVRWPNRGVFHVSTHDEAFIGFGFLIHIELNSENRDHEVGYRLARESWGKGYATEIGRALLEYGFQSLNLREIYGTTEPRHLVSQRVLMKLGLRERGEASYYGGCKIFKITRGEFK